MGRLPIVLRRPAVRRALGLAATACFAVHVTVQLWLGRPWDALWGCHLASALIGVGLTATVPSCNAVGSMWLLMGVPLWLVNLATGGECDWTSYLTHIGGTLLGGIGVLVLGLPRGSWWRAVAAFLLLQQLSRWVTPVHANVNLAFAVWTGWEERSPSYFWYMTMLLSVAAVLFLVVERLWARFCA